MWCLRFYCLLCLVKFSTCDGYVTAEVFMVGGHAEAGGNQPGLDQPVTSEPVPAYKAENAPTPPVAYNIERESDGTLFIPNDAPVARVDDGYLSNDNTLNGIMSGNQNFADIMNGPRLRAEQEEKKQPDGVFFVSGKNSERMEPDSREQQEMRRKGKKRKNEYQSYKPDNRKSEPKMDCSRPYICNMTQAPICGGRVENNKNWKYRLFMSECFMNRVNCGFKSDINKYTIVDMENCDAIASRNNVYPQQMHYAHHLRPKPKELDMNLEARRRSFISRRSSNMDRVGRMCNHQCPSSCPEDYAPVCAMSSTGTKKMFMNHCLLDYNSCLYGVSWRTVQLAECIGQQRADMRSNRGFIGWLQRIGIIDSRGRLVSQTD